MRERGDMQVRHEPFLYHHYLNVSERMFPDFDPEPDHPRTYADSRAMLLDLSAQGPVFFKDMAYYALDDLLEDDGFLRVLSHAFLVRDPAEAILSYHKRDPEFIRSELGIDAQFRLYQALLRKGLSPLVITSDQLREAPEATLARYWQHAGLPFVRHAFQWDDKVPDGWQAVVGWHGDVLKRGAIEKPHEKHDTRAELAELGAPFTEYDRHHRPFYEALREIAETQAHQK